jgi:hypothetical protein
MSFLTSEIEENSTVNPINCHEIRMCETSNLIWKVKLLGDVLIYNLYYLLIYYLSENFLDLKFVYTHIILYLIFIK